MFQLNNIFDAVKKVNQSTVTQTATTINNLIINIAIMEVPTTTFTINVNQLARMEQSWKNGMVTQHLARPPD